MGAKSVIRTCGTMAGGALVGEGALEACKWAYKGISAAAGSFPMSALSWNVWLGLAILIGLAIWLAADKTLSWYREPTKKQIIGQVYVDTQDKLERLVDALEARDQSRLVILAEQAADIGQLKADIAALKANRQV